MNNILEYLECTAACFPERTAVEDDVCSVTWKELLTTAKQVGSVLAKRISFQEPVAILTEKSVKTLALMLGVVYAGGFYVVVDPAQPAERMKQILHTLQPALILVENDPAEKVQEWKGENILVAESVFGSGKTNHEELLRERRKRSSDDDILYGIFTSGSTGVPKGITVTHRAVIDFITHFIETFGFTKEDHIGNQAPFDFDVSVKDIYTCIMTGAKLVILPRKLFSTPPLLLDWLCEKKVTVLIWAVSALTLVSSLKGLAYRVPESVRMVLFSGEVMPVQQLILWQKALPEAAFINLYGPSEITCNCTFYRVPQHISEDVRIPIGYPFDGREVFLLDQNGKEVTQKGRKGEICVSGESLAKGYYHNPQETQKHFFLWNHLMTYRTGDLGFYGEKKELYFAGRKDFQIKHMGHRIELEEIERALNRMDGVEKSCCLLDQKKNQLVAFYQGEAEKSQIRAQLKKQVPIYMVPHKMIRISVFPLNKNGKTDRKELYRKLEVG